MICIPVEPRILLFIIIGLAVAGAIGLEHRLRKSLLSLPILYVGLGFLVFSLPIDLGWLNPAFDAEEAILTEYATELIVIMSLMTVGLAIDRPFSWRHWKQVLPLLLLTMPLCIAGVAWLGWSWLGLSPAAAVLLGACLSPTDPVLATAVQVGPPGDEERNDVRFNLSAEAGFNDSLAFPFVYLAIALSTYRSPGEWLGHWIAVDVLWRVCAGAATGWLLGRGAAYLVFRKLAQQRDRRKKPMHAGEEGLVVISLLLTAYGIAELVEGYGFLSVFVGAVTIKQFERKNRMHQRTHSFIDQVEKVTLVIILLCFGSLLASGVFRYLTLPGVFLSLAFLLIIRPVAGALAVSRSGLKQPGAWAVGFLGVRGIGSFYYLAYGQRHGDFHEVGPLWATVAFTVLLSIVIHGIAAPRILRHLEVKNAHVIPGGYSEDSTDGKTET